MPFFVNRLLTSLHIRDYALIEELDVEFADGLNIITGETGAGKSILLGALGLLMGARASTEVVRTGATRAVVEGFFATGGRSEIDQILRNAQVELQPTLIVRREVTATQSRAFVNDTPVTLRVLKDLADEMIDLHGQHQHQSLLRDETHRQFVDEIGDYRDTLTAFQRVYDDVELIDREIQALIVERSRLAERRELSEFQLSEIDAVGPIEGEEDELTRELSILDNAETLRVTADQVYEDLYDTDDAVIDRLDRLQKELEGAVRFDETLQSYVAEMRSVIIILQEVASSLNNYSSEIDSDPKRLSFVRERLGDYHKLSRKYGSTASEMLAHAAELRDDLAKVENFDDRLREMETSKNTLLQELSVQAKNLSKARRSTADVIEKGVVAALEELNIKEARFEVRADYIVDDEGWVVHESGDRVRTMRHGYDRIRFFLSTNPGEAVRPLVDVASGGEISRVMLALKTILARTGGIPLMVFDEIDTGISGRVAQQVGSKLRDLAANHQVISITHLPQIAAMADRHFVVEKHVEQARTRSKLRMLDEEERAECLASLISGAEVTAAAITSARELLDSVRSN
ncbi:MAG: DNA repair protein RecN [Rhodothermales bacterium]|nr:DNA repair protein RecN [Rhodothermales bacterium]